MSLMVVPDGEQSGPLLACESCGTQRQGALGEEHEDLRERLRTSGWLCRTISDGREIDVCPRCRPGR